MRNKTINYAIENGLCTGCGLCVSLCPNNALKMDLNEKKGIYVPNLSNDICNQCGICYKICPGISVDYQTLNFELFGNENVNILIGNYINCYIGHINDYNIRYNSTSGGIVTQLLIFALEEGIIDGAIVTKMKSDNPLEPEPFIARTKEDIIEASKSKYCPVPVNVVIRKILNSHDNEKFAIVGLPCHINGIRKAEQINKKLRKKICLHLGLFCNHTPNFWATKFLLRKIGVQENDVVKLDYRAGGWPGYMKIYTKSRVINYYKAWNFLGLYSFYPNRCLMCSDAVCELSDISFGDAWLPETDTENIGMSIIISRTKVGDNIINKMVINHLLNLNAINARKVIQSQSTMLYLKKKNLNCYKSLKIIPQTNNTLNPDIVDYLIGLLIFINVYISSKLFFKNSLLHIPIIVHSLYFRTLSFISSRKAKRDFKKF